MLNDYVNNDGTKLNADDILAVWTLYWVFLDKHCYTTVALRMYAVASHAAAQRI